MAYADFSYYETVFKGNLIHDESTFRTYSERASEYIDAVTFGRLTNESLLEKYIENIKKCCCALTENIFNSERSQGLSSESIGEYSVTYNSSYHEHQPTRNSVVLMYLGNTGLLFRGV